LGDPGLTGGKKRPKRRGTGPIPGHKFPDAKKKGKSALHSDRPSRDWKCRSCKHKQALTAFVRLDRLLMEQENMWLSLVGRKERFHLRGPDEGSFFFCASQFGRRTESPGRVSIGAVRRDLEGFGARARPKSVFQRRSSVVGGRKPIRFFSGPGFFLCVLSGRRGRATPSGAGNPWGAPSPVADPRDICQRILGDLNPSSSV